MAKYEPRAVDGILDISLEAGTIILQNGGETYRTEETMLSIASSLGARSASAFVTPTVVMLTCTDMEGESHTRIERINERSINLGRITRVNELSRRLENSSSQNSSAQNTNSQNGSSQNSSVREGKDRRSGMNRDFDLVFAILSRIRKSRPHNPAGVVVATGVASFCFSLMFMGTLREALVAFAVGCLMRLVLYLVTPLGLSSFISSVIGGFVISCLSGAAVFAGLAPSSGNVSIAVLMSLVPGLAIVNAIRDIISGDLVAGSARLLDAFVIAAALSLGAAFGLMLFPAESGYVSSLLFLAQPVSSFLLAFFATASFAYFFHIRRYDIFWTSLLGATGWLVYLLVAEGFSGITFGYMAGALSVGILAECAAYLFRKPATVYIVPGIIPLVPGGGMYETMLYSVWGQMDQATVTGFRTLTAAGSIAVGIALASSLSRLVSRIRSNVRDGKRAS